MRLHFWICTRETPFTSEVLTRLCSALGHSCRSHKFRPKGTTSVQKSQVSPEGQGHDFGGTLFSAIPYSTSAVHAELAYCASVPSAN